MATVNKDFRIKSGLVVEGTNATVNGEDIITTASSTNDLQEGSSNLYFTDQRAIDAVGGTATSSNTPSTVVKRDGSGNFAANNITADVLTIGTSGTISTEGLLAIDSANGTLTSISGDSGVNISSGNGDIVLNADGSVYLGSNGSSGNRVATYGHLDTLIGDGSVNGSTGNTIKDRIDSAVSNLVDSAPALLDTLNELAAAIADNPNYASDMATSLSGKQNNLTASTGITIDGSSNISVTANTYDAYGSADSAEGAANSYTDGQITSALVTAQGYANTAESNANTYTDNAVQAIATNGLYDVAGSAATAQSNANSYTDTAISNGNSSATPRYQAIELTYYRKEEATWTGISAGQSATVHAFGSTYGSAKYLVRVLSNGHSQTSEVLVVRDQNNNIAITEYGIVYTGESEIASITATHDGTNTNLIATATNGQNNIEVMTAATLLAYWD